MTFKMSFNVLVLLVLVFTKNSLTFPVWNKVKFYRDRLNSTDECNLFQNSDYEMARCFIYYDRKQQDKFFLDRNFTFSLSTCAYSTSASAVQRYLITEFRGMNLIKDRDWDYYQNLTRKTEKWIGLIPQFNVIAGPGGTKKDVISKPPKNLYDVWMVVSASEEENPQANYSKDFKVRMEDLALQFGRHGKTAVQLNGWHLANSPDMLEWSGLRVFTAVIIYTTDTQPVYLQEIRSKIPLRYNKFLVFDVLPAKSVRLGRWGCSALVLGIITLNKIS